MSSANHWMSYASHVMETDEESKLQQRLGLYQVFLKLYEHRQDLLNEILSLEISDSRSLASVKLLYLQGMMLDQPHLITNLVQGKTQALFQPKPLQSEFLQSQLQWVIGRDPQRSSITVQDRRLSRTHAVIQYVAQQGFYLADLGSRNGTFVNGEPIRQSVLLQDGDRVRLGSLSFVFFVCALAQEPASSAESSGSSASDSSGSDSSPVMVPQVSQGEIVYSPFSITASEKVDCPQGETALHRNPVRVEQENSPPVSSLEATYSFLK